MKLTPLQQIVVSKMEEGWNLGYDTFGDHSWLQKNELGHGGETYRVPKITFKSLVAKGTVVYHSEIYPTKKYILNKAK